MRFPRAAAALLLVALAACPEDPASPTTEPKAPEAPTIGEATPGNASAKIAFTPPADTGTAPITEYLAACTAGSATVNGSGIASPVNVTGLTNGTTYTCSVKAKNSVGTSAASGTVTVTPVTVPSAPTISSVATGVGQLTVTFIAGANGGSPITEFTATCSPPTGNATSATGTASPITVTGLANATSYSCRVSAKSAIGTGALSAATSGSTASVPGAPSIGTATASNGQVSVTFSAPTNTGGSSITGYTASCTPTGGAAVTADGTSSPIVVTGLSNGTQYACSVVARNAVGTGTASTSVNATPATVPDAPTIGTATAGNASISVAFTAPASNGGSAITLYTASCRIGTGAATTGTGSSSPVTVSNLTNGSTYDCTVTAKNAIGTSAASAVASAKPLGPPGVPTIGTATAGDKQATIAFTAPTSTGGSPITGYTASCVTGSSTAVTATGGTSPITVTSLTNGSAYACSVKATNAVGTSSASGTVAVTPRTVPDAPTIGTITAFNQSLSVAFTAPASNGGATITGYTASCVASGTTRTGTGTASPISVSLLTNGTQYACSVYATNVAGNGPSSSTANGTPAPASGTSFLCGYTYSAVNSAITGNPGTTYTSTVSYTCSATTRTMTGNQIPDHPAAAKTSGNPNTMSAQTTPAATTFTLTPAVTATVTQKGNVVGWAINGVKFDPATAEVCPNTSYCTSSTYPMTGSWNVEALGQTLFSAGVDGANAHIQPGGAYHYHGMPDAYLTYLNKGQKLTLIGFAVDGFPIYAKWGYTIATDSTSPVIEMKSSWQKKASPDAGRASTTSIPMGTFTQDWEYKAGTGDLDECNGRTGVTPEFPNGTYAYYITNDFPYIQRCLKGTVPSTGPGGTGSGAKVGRRPPGR